MSTGQMYSGKGETTSPSQENGEKTVQTVNTPDQSNISSSVSPSNATAVTPLIIRVPDFFASQCVSEEQANALRTLIKDTCEAAFAKERVAGFPDYAAYLGQFEEAMNQIISRSLASYEASEGFSYDTVSFAPSVYAQVPPSLLGLLRLPDLVQDLESAVEAMRDYARDATQGLADFEVKKWMPLYDIVVETFTFFIKDAVRRLKGLEASSSFNVRSASEVTTAANINAQVEAAITHFVTSNSGSDLPDEELYKLGEQIKRIVSRNFGGQQASFPVTTSPILVQVPELIADAVKDAKKLYGLRRTLEAMENAAKNDAQFVAEYATFEQVVSAIHFMVSAAEHTVNVRSFGSDAAPTPSPRAEVTSAEVDPNEVEPGVYDKCVVLDRAATTYLDACKGGGKSVTIESNTIFFDMLANPTDLGQFIRNITAWYVSWIELDGFKNYGDVPEAHRCFANLMEFLSVLPQAISDHELDNLQAELKGGQAK